MCGAWTEFIWMPHLGLSTKSFLSQYYFGQSGIPALAAAYDRQKLLRPRLRAPYAHSYIHKYLRQLGSMAIKQANNSRFFLMMDDIPSHELLTRINCTSRDITGEDLKLNQKMLSYPITAMPLLHACTPIPGRLLL